MEIDEIRKLTGCMKPCRYRKYIFPNEKQPQPGVNSDNSIFSLWAVSKKTRYEVEHLIYPLSSLVAELGGTLGLFLGFSFLGVFDALVNISCSAINVFMNVSF